MSTVEQLETLLKQQKERDSEILEEVRGNIAQTFPDEKQASVVFDLYSQVYKLTGDTQELNHGSIFLNSYVESFHKLLVGDGKTFTDEEFKHYAEEAYKASMDAILKATEGLKGEAEQ